MTCPGCQQPAEFKGYRPKTVESLLGTVHYRRGYYHCGRCGHGLFPFDDEAGLGPHRLTPGAERIVGLLGLSCDSFEEAAQKVLPEACGLHLGESTVRLVTEDAGARLGKLHEDGHALGDSKPFEWHKDAQGRTCAYVSLDLTGVPQQAKGGGPAEGRMPYVAAVYNPVPERAAEAAAAPLPVPGYQPVAETVAAATALPKSAQDQTPARPRMQARYLAGLLSLAALGLLLRKQAGQVGMEKAEQWIGISDGGNGLEDFLRTNFNRANLVIILDFWHPTGYLEALARAMHPDDEDRRVSQMKSWCHLMKHKGGAAILRGTAGSGNTQEQESGPSGASGGGDVHQEQRPSDGLPVLSVAGLADRLRTDRVGVQDGGGSASETGGHALARIRHRQRLPPPRPVQERQGSVGCLLGTQRELTFRSFTPQ